MGYLKSCKCQCKDCTEQVLIGTPYRNEYVHRSDGWWHTECLKNNQGRRKINWDTIFDATKVFVQEFQDKEDLIQYICKQYSVTREELNCFMFGGRLTQIYKGALTMGDAVKPRDVINILSDNMYELNKMNKKDLFGMNRLYWDLSVVFNNFWNKYKSSQSSACDFEIKDNSEYRIQYRKKPVVQQETEDVLGDLDEEIL